MQKKQIIGIISIVLGFIFACGIVGWGTYCMTLSRIKRYVVVEATVIDAATMEYEYTYNGMTYNSKWLPYPEPDYDLADVGTKFNICILKDNPERLYHPDMDMNSGLSFLIGLFIVAIGAVFLIILIEAAIKMRRKYKNKP